jgi:hypothetical protein
MSNFPKDNIDPRDKNSEWLVKVAKAIWDESKQLNANIFYHGKWKFQEYRDYANGNQSTDKYRNYLRPKDANGKRPDEYQQLDYNVIPFMPKFKKIALGKIRKVGYNIVATALDTLARDDEEDYFAEQKAKIKLLEELRDIPGIETMLDLGDDDPRTMEEVKIKQQHSYKHDAAIEAEKGLSLIFANNKYEQILNKIIADLFDFGVGGVKRYFDDNGKIRIRHADMMEFVCSYCREEDFSDANYMGEVVYYSLGQIREAGNFTEDEVRKIAEQKGWYNHYPNKTTKALDDNKVAVLDFEYKSFNESVYEKYKNRFGNEEVRKTDFRKRKSKKGEIARDGKEVIYKGKWIIGTDMIYEDGLQTNMLRKQGSMKETCFSWHLQAPGMDHMTFFGISEAMIPVADQIQLAWLKLQAFLLNVAPPGIAFDLRAMENLNLGHGGEKWTPRQVLELYKQRGDIAYRSVNEEGDPVGGIPITQLQSQLSGYVNEITFLINSFLGMMRDNIGFNEITDGSTPDPRTLNGVANLAYQSTSNALYHIIQGVKFLNENLADKLVVMMQEAFSKGVYLKAMGINSQRFWKTTADISLHDLAVKLEDKPSDEEIARMDQKINIAMERGEITIADSVYLETINNIKEKGAVLSYLVKKNAEEQHAREMEKITANVEGQKESAMVAEDEKRKTLEAEYAFKTQYMTKEKEMVYQIEEMKLRTRLQEAATREQGRIATKQVENQGKENIKRMENTEDYKI